MTVTKVQWLRAALLAAAAAMAVTVAGCGGAASIHHPAAAGQRVTIEGINALRFTPMTVHVHTGTVRITLKDTGAYPHNIVIPGLKVTSPTVTGDPGGSIVHFTVTFAHRGRYPFHCQYHVSSGMTGVFVVS